MTAKRFTNIEHDYENAWIKCNDDGDFMIYAIYKELDESLPSLEDLLNGLHEENKELIEENEQLKTKNNAYIQDIEVFKEENTHLKLENEMLKNGVVHYNLLKEDIETVLNYIGTNIVLNFARNDDTYSLNDRERLAYMRLSKSIGNGYEDVNLEKW